MLLCNHSKIIIITSNLHSAGGNGQPGSPGQDAGSAVLELVAASGPLASNINVKFGRDTNTLSPHSINAPNRGVIVVYAKGGCGGWGGNGGKGGDGGIGGRGGNGGAGHDGKDGGQGQDGGQIMFVPYGVLLVYSLSRILPDIVCNCSN
jgi:hypothetical protein